MRIQPPTPSSASGNKEIPEGYGAAVKAKADTTPYSKGIDKKQAGASPEMKLPSLTSHSLKFP